MSVIDLTGKQFGNWTVLYRAEDKAYGNNGKKRTMWHCRCVCGVERDVFAPSLTRGVSKSCGCIQKLNGKMTTTQDLVGMHFGRWVVISRAQDHIKPDGRHIMHMRGEL